MTESLEVVGQKKELYPLHRSRAKQRLVAATPARLASAIFSRLGPMVVARAQLTLLI